MEPINTPFTAIYVQWLESFRAMFPGGARLEPSEESRLRQEQIAANQEWEDEGGSIKPPADSKPDLAPAPKIPF